LALFLTFVVVGCASRPADRASSHLVLFVHGAGGDGFAYNALVDEMQAALPGARIERLRWGSPVFMINFSNASVHNKAETSLARRIESHHATHPQGRVDVVAHSAGCGVALGALNKTSRAARRVILLTPSVSPGFDLSGALAKSESVYSFCSDRDTLFLKWRVSTFGCYDRIKTPAAGFTGFTRIAPNLTQIAYDDAWKKLGNDGGHFGTLARDFVRELVIPLLR